MKWDVPDSDDVIPMWVADMDFQAAPAIRRALAERVAHGVFGYELVPESYYQAIVSWFKRRHDWTIDRNWIIYTRWGRPRHVGRHQGTDAPWR